MIASYSVWKSGDTPFFFRMVSTADYRTPMPGLSPAPTLQLARPGGGLASCAADVAEVGAGWYRATNPGLYGVSDPYGMYLLIATATGARGEGLYSVEALDPGRSMSLQVLGENMSDMKTQYADETLAQALHNAFNWNKSGDPDAPSGVRLAPAGLDEVEIEDDVNVRQAISVIGATILGRSVGLATTSATFYAIGAPATTGTSVVRVVAAVDTSGNRGTVTITPPA